MLYLMLIYQDDAAMNAASPSERQAIGEAYGAFNQFLAQSGALRGTATWPPAVTTMTKVDGEIRHSDGAFSHAADKVAGFFLIEVESLDAAKRFAERVPGTQYGAVEIRPVQN